MVTALAELLRLSFATSLLLVFNQKDYLEVKELLKRKTPIQVGVFLFEFILS
jgi:hypothetical protein